MGFISAIIGWLQYHLGLRTDTASSTGSLHAKTMDIKNSATTISNHIGTSSDSRASNTVMGWLKSPIKSVQQGTITISYNSNFGSATITEVDTSKAILIPLGVKGNSSAGVPDDPYVQLTLYSTGIQAYRGTSSTSGTNNNLAIGWMVVEFY